MTFQNLGASRDGFNDGFYLRELAKRMLDDRLKREDFLQSRSLVKPLGMPCS